MKIESAVKIRNGILYENFLGYTGNTPKESWRRVVKIAPWQLRAILTTLEEKLPGEHIKT